MKELLFINACVRKNSRTRRLCAAYLAAWGAGFAVREVDLAAEGLMPLTAETLASRDAAVSRGDFSGARFRYAKTIAAADRIVIGAPYWDNSFPAALKVYFEHTSVDGLTFGYHESGAPFGLCRADRLVYITTAGGYIGARSSGEAYIRDMCAMYGIPEVEVFTAEGLDIRGNDAEAILVAAETRIAEQRFDKSAHIS